MVYEKDRVAYYIKSTISTGEGNPKDRETETWVKYKNGFSFPRVLPCHLFSEYRWSPPGHDLHEFVKIPTAKIINSKWYHGKKQARRAKERMCTELLEYLTDAMIDDMIEQRNSLIFRILKERKAYIRMAKLGIYETSSFNPNLTLIFSKTVKWTRYRKRFWPKIGISMPTREKMLEYHYKTGYAKLHLQRSFTKNRRPDRLS